MEAWRDELYHHGILGQKWGVRRYQNPDGTYTDAGRRRYNAKGIAKSIATIGDDKEVKRSGYSQAAPFFLANKNVERSVPVKRFNENSEEYEKLQVHKQLLDTIERATNIKVNKELEAQLGKFQDLLEQNKDKEIDEYLDRGQKLFNDYMQHPSAKKLSDNYRQASLDYEHAAVSFSKDFFGKYGDTPVAGTVAVDKGSDVARKMTVYEVFATEMLRNAGGII